MEKGAFIAAKLVLEIMGLEEAAFWMYPFLFLVSNGGSNYESHSQACFKNKITIGTLGLSCDLLIIERIIWSKVI